MSKLKLGVREVAAFLSVMFFAAIGIGLLVIPVERWVWFKVALGVYMLGQAFREFTYSAPLTPLRHRLGLSMCRGFKLICTIHLVEGSVVIVGALVSLERVFGLIIAFGAFCWVWIWGWALAHSEKWREPPDMAPSL